jgi:hypothetical protein
VLLALPAWLLPAGVAIDLCVCSAQAAPGSCCAPEAPPCCAPTDEEQRAAPNCDCSVEVPGHAEEGLALEARGLVPAVPGSPVTARIPRAARRGSERHDALHRPHGPSPGGSVPLPLRL